MKPLLALWALSTGVLFAQPTITAIQNNYGRIAQGASNYGIAQGSIFIVKGSNLSNTNNILGPLPQFPTVLDGVKIHVVVGSFSADVPLYYVLPFQLAGILPSTTPEGTGTLTVTNNNQTSAPAVLIVKKSAFGVLTYDYENGTGRVWGVNATDSVPATYGTYAGDSGTGTKNSPSPGNFILLFGSGLGPTSGSDATPPTQGNFDNIPISIKIGGVDAQVLYHGRSTFAGLDQVNIKIPTLTSPSDYSCDVPMVITVNGILANTTTIPVAQSGTTCTPANNGGNNGGGNGGGSTSYPSLTQSQINAIVGRGAYKVGSLSLTRSRTFNLTTSGSTSTDSVDGSFNAVTPTGSASLSTYLNNFGFASGFTLPAAGVCNVFNGFAPPTLTGFTTTSLDAGTSITAQGPPGTKVMPKSVDSGFISYSASVTPPAAAGNYSFNNGGGGPDVGAFNVSVTVGPELQWTNRASITQVNRSTALTVNWTGGQPGSLVALEGISQAINGSSVTGFGFICWANQSAGQLTVPANILSQLPATSSISVGGITQYLSPGALVMVGNDNYATATASGVDLVVATSSTNISLSGVPYK